MAKITSQQSSQVLTGSPRKIKEYRVLEQELDRLSEEDTSNAWFQTSLGIFFGSITGCVQQIMDHSGNYGIIDIIFFSIPLVFLILSIFFFFWRKDMRQNRKDIINSIKHQSSFESPHGL